MKIVIVGGGTAGWLAALMIKSVHKDSHDVTLIESSKIGIIGAGEGSTGYLTDIIQGNTWDYGCNELDFFKKTSATVKLGIRHRNWSKNGGSYTAPIDGPPRNTNGTEYMLMWAIENDIPFHTVSENGQYIEKSSSSFWIEDEKLENSRGHAYHFDARLVGQYFKEVCGTSVHHIDSEITNISINSAGIVENLTISDGSTIDGDFFIDASGFSRVISKKMDIAWKSYSENLPLNSAIPFFLPHTSKIDPVTTAWAQKNGWVWMIPTQERYGCGYVFDDRFISADDAHREVEMSLGRSIEPIRTIKFDAGRLETLWKNNVLSIGLAAAFSEPLEATSIHTTILQLNSFIFEYLRDTISDTCNQASVFLYNKRMIKMYDDMMNFLNIHYVGGRIDSPFWKWVSSGEMFTDSTKMFLEMQKSRGISPTDLDQYWGHAESGLYNWIMAGLGIIDKRLASKELDAYGQRGLAQNMYSVRSMLMQERLNVTIDNTEFIKMIGNERFGNSFSE